MYVDITRAKSMEMSRQAKHFYATEPAGEYIQSGSNDVARQCRPASHHRA
jgi:hypothetical protein